MPKEIIVEFDDDPTPSPAESFETAKPIVAPRRKRTDPRELEPPAPIVAAPPRNASAHLNGHVGRTLPHSLEAEEYLLSCCFLDGEDVVRRCLEARIKYESFYDTKHGIIFDQILALYNAKKPIAIDVVAEELKKSRELDVIGGYAFLTQVSSRIPTTAQASYFIEKVREQAALRMVIRSATGMVEDAYGFTGDIDAFLSDAKHKIDAVDAAARPIERHRRRGLLEFQLVPKSHHSVLLGRRYLNRGDIGIIVSSSGMGKSSMEIQMAILWALGRDSFGIECNGGMTSLILQSEDSDGDIAEVVASVCHRLQLTDGQRCTVNERVILITDRVNRGAKFIASLRRHIDEVKPDFVWINPLQAFMDGDIKESKDLGAFLREGLNSLNEPAKHAYMLVHHTNKIGGASIKDKASPSWFDMMYGMAGGAELINAARAILILEPQKTEGHFNLNLAKRGKRAGATRQVEVQEGMSVRLELITKIPLKHASEMMEGPDGKMPVIFWESRPEDIPELGTDGKIRGGGRKSSNNFNDWRDVFPLKTSPGLPPMQLLRVLEQEKPIAKASLFDALKRWETEGEVERVPQPAGATSRWRRAR